MVTLGHRLVLKCKFLFLEIFAGRDGLSKEYTFNRFSALKTLSLLLGIVFRLLISLQPGIY